MRVEKILASYGLTLDEVADLLEIPAFKEIKEARSKAQSSDNLAFQLATLDDKLAEYLRTEEVKEILEANKKEAVEEDEGSDFDDLFGEAGDSFWESLGVDADDESARVRVQTEVSGESSPPVVMPSEEEEKVDEFYVKTFYDIGIGTFLTILGEGETPQVDDSGNVFFSRDELHFKAFMDEDAKSFRQIALNGQKVTMAVFSENQDIVQEAVFEGQNPQVIVKSKDDIQSRELSDVSSIYDTENSLNFTKPFSMVEARTLVTAMNGSKADLTNFILPLGVAIDPNLTQKSNYVFSPKTMYDLADCEEFFKVSVGGYGYITNYCEGNELQHLQFFELAGSAHLNVPYEKGAKSTITLSTIVNKQFNANMQKVLDAPVQENEPLTLVGFAPALPSQVPYADVDLLSEQAGYFVLFHKDAGRAIYLPAVIANYFRKYYGEDVTFNIGLQSGTNGEMVVVFKSEDDIVGFHIVQREHAPVTQVARLLIQNQMDFMHDVQTEFASAFENKIDLEQAMGVETKYTFKDEVFEEIVKKPKKARKSKPKAKKKVVKKGKSEADQVQDIIDELREIILLFDVTDDAEEIAEIEGEIEVLNDIREELISEEADDPMKLDEEELTEDEEMIKDISESPEPQDIEEMAEVVEGITFPTPSGMNMEAMVDAEDDDDDLFADLFDDEDSVTPEPEEIISPDTIAGEDKASKKVRLTFSFNPDNLPVDDAVQMVEKYTNDWRTFGDISATTISANLNFEEAENLIPELPDGYVYDVQMFYKDLDGKEVLIFEGYQEAFDSDEDSDLDDDDDIEINEIDLDFAKGGEVDLHSGGYSVDKIYEIIRADSKNSQLGFLYVENFLELGAFTWDKKKINRYFDELIDDVKDSNYGEGQEAQQEKEGDIRALEQERKDALALDFEDDFFLDEKIGIGREDDALDFVNRFFKINEKRLLEVAPQVFQKYEDGYAKGGEVKAKVEKFMATDPSEEEIETFYMREVLPHDKRSISEIMAEEKFAEGGVLDPNAEIQKIVDAMTDNEVAEKVTNLIFSSLDSLEGDMTASEAYDYALENIEDAREHLVELADAMDLKDELK